MRYRVRVKTMRNSRHSRVTSRAVVRWRACHCVEIEDGRNLANHDATFPQQPTTPTTSTHQVYIQRLHIIIRPLSLPPSVFLHLCDHVEAEETLSALASHFRCLLRASLLCV